MLKKKIESLVKPDKEISSKKKIESLVVFVVILVITIVAINSIWNGDKHSSKNNTDNSNKNFADVKVEAFSQENTYNNNTNLEEKLESILGSMSGVGKVKVFINYSESSMIEAMYNETTKESSTEETDTSGGVRTIQQTDTQKDVIYSEDGGNKTPVTQKVTNPTIEGAIITAQGASDSNIKANIVDAVSAATGLATHKIQVFKMNN